jgi:hypothetical protein
MAKKRDGALAYIWVGNGVVMPIGVQSSHVGGCELFVILSA